MLMIPDWEMPGLYLAKKNIPPKSPVNNTLVASEELKWTHKLWNETLIQFAIDVVDRHAETFRQTHVSWMNFFKTNKLIVSSLLESFWVLNFFNLQQVNNFLLKVSSRVKNDHFSKLPILYD